jgi:hypothetical protein
MGGQERQRHIKSYPEVYEAENYLANSKLNPRISYMMLYKDKMIK